MPYFGVSGSNFEKLFSCLKSAPRICLVAKFGGNIKIFKFGVKISDLGYFVLEGENNTAIFEISAIEF